VPGICLLSLLIAGCASSPEGTAEAAPPKEDPSRKPAPGFSLKDADGRAVNLADYRGKVVLLNFWATWCGPCKIEIPWFMEFEQRYKDRGFAVLGVAMDDDGWEVVKPYVAKNKINYRILMGNDDVAAKYGGVDSLPTTYIIDQNGRIVSTHVGLVSKSEYEDDIAKLLDGGKRSSAATVHYASR
jgi:cytochrome c biogenesis protein CcmG/thiol:disulfide interchange protein DsbE